MFGGDTEKDQVSKIVSEVVDIVMKSKQSWSDLLSSDTNARILQEMRVPDWFLLYFKLQTKLPDSGWQTLLNLTQLWKSGVSICVIVYVV